MVGATDGGSFRDPAGHVYQLDGRILRTVSERAAGDYEYVRDCGLLHRGADAGWLVQTKEVGREEAGAWGKDARYLLEHPRLPFISYPYEWSFPALKAAALLHLDIQLMALEEDVSFSDASAYNVQFLGSRPIFIDVLSFRRYRAGEFWIGHRQFCEQFLNPLLLRALLGVPYNAWYRGGLEGITAQQLNRVLPFRQKLSWNVMSQVLLPARWQQRATEKLADDRIARLRERQLSRTAYLGLLKQLRDWIARLEPLDTGRTVWGEYETSHTYASEEETAKRSFVAQFVEQTRPAMLWDLGCNAGAYSELALEAGAAGVIGFDSDHGALERAFARAQSRQLNFQPLFLDAADPSPGQGWNGVERRALQARAEAQAVLALAFVHHLAIGRNIPLDQVVHWIVSLAPAGIIEFVQKSDPTVRQMLALREDIFDHYTVEVFVAALESRCRVVRSQEVSGTGRTLFQYDRS
jgi:ribosomal protein L11 methylase PrmA